MTESKIKSDKNIRNNTGAILNPAACGTKPTKNFLSVGFSDSGICEYIEDTVLPPNNAPVIDLNGAGVGTDAAGTFTEGDGAETYLTAATVSDADGDELATLTIVGTDGFGEDTSNDIVSFSAEAYPSNANKTATVVAGSTTFQIAFVTATKTFTITKNGGGTFPAADCQALVRLFAYNNTATPPDTSDRVFTFVVNDGTANSATATLTVTVEESITAPSLTNPGDRYVARNQTIAPITIANAGSSASSSITSGTLPTGLSFSNGTISGTVDGAATIEVVTIEVTFTNGAGSDAVTFDIDVRASFTEIDSGDTFPYYALTDDELYVATEGVTVETALFFALGTNQVLDLGGNTWTYDQTTPITVTNSGFETAGSDEFDIVGWTVSTPGAAERVAAVTGMYGSWCLEIASISSPITIVSDPIAIPEADVEYAARVVAKSTYSSSVTIEVYDDVTDGLLATATSSNVGSGYYPFVQFVPTTTNNVRIEVTCTPTGTKTFHLDDIDLMRSRNFGVIGSPNDFNLPTHLATTTVTSNASGMSSFVCTNGTIVQGTGQSFEGHPLFVRAATNGICDHVTVQAGGANVRHIQSQSATNPTITNCTVIGEMTHITNRQLQYAGIQLTSAAGVVVCSNNELYGTMHAGIVMTRNTTTTSAITISDNYVHHTSIGTDGYGIILNNCKNFTVTNNIVQPIDGRGLLLDGYNAGTTSGGVISGNTIEARETPNIEYTALEMEATALRMRNYSDSTFSDILFDSNTFFAETGEDADWAAVAGRFTFNNSASQMDDSNVRFVDNVFRARLNSIDADYTGAREPRAWGISLSTCAAGTGVYFTGNTFESNDVSINSGDNDGYDGVVSGVLFYDNTISKLSSGATMTHRGVVVGDWANQTTNFRLLNNSYTNGAVAGVTFLESKTKDVTIGYVLTVNVDDGAAVDGATVTVTDAGDTEIDTALTNVSGVAYPVEGWVTTYSQETSDPNTISTTTHTPLVVDAVKDAAVGSESGIAPTANTTVDVTIVAASAPVMEESATGSSTGDGGSGNGSVSITHGWTIAEGDLIVAVAHVNSNRTVTPPSGFTTEEDTDPPGSSEHAYLFWKYATASEPTTYTFTGSDNFCQQAVRVMRISGAADPASTAMVVAAATSTSSGATQTAPSVTPTNDNSLVLLAIFDDVTSQTFTQPSGTTSIGSFTSAGTDGHVAYFEADASATGTKDWTVGTTWHANYLMWSIAIAPG